MNKKLRKQLYFLASVFCRGWRLRPSNDRIDVIIPVVEKDLKVLPLCLEGVRCCICHRLTGIYIVAPASENIQNFCKEHEVTFVDENSVLGYGVKDINYQVDGTDRSGWIFQQLLKLSGSIGTSENYLVIDADHVLLRQHTFISSDNRQVFYQSKEYHLPYYRKIEQLLGITRFSRLSYVDHKMLFSRKRLSEMKQQIEQRIGESWDKAILHTLDPHELSSFSEYETYGTFVPKTEKRLLPWRNKNLTYDQMLNYYHLCMKYGSKYRSVTFPDYKNK